MIKRLSVIALLTGIAFTFNLMVLRIITRYVDAGPLTSIGEIDSVSNLIITLIALGLLTSAVRNIALADDWQEELKKSKQARLTLGILLMPLAFLYFVNPIYLLFFFSPVFALNADYALYGRSRPVTGAVIACIKVVFPCTALLLTAVFSPSNIVPVFLISTVLIYLFIGIVISRQLSVPYLVTPSWKSLILYLHSISLGIVSFSYYFLGLGLISVAVYFYPTEATGFSYLSIKLYIIFKGVLRIINQSFVKELVSDTVGLRVDHLATMAGVSFLIAALFFQKSMTQLFFGAAADNNVSGIYILAIGGLIVAMFTSLTTKAVLYKKDIPYAIVTSAAIVVTTGIIITASYFTQSVSSIFWGLTAGEMVSVGGLILLNKENILKNRFMMLFQTLPFFIIPVLARATIGDTVLSLLLGTGSALALLLFINRKSLVAHES